MASIYCRSGTWIVAYKDSDGKRHDKSFGKGDEAKDNAEKFAFELDNTPNSKITFVYLITEFLNHLAAMKAVRSICIRGKLLWIPFSFLTLGAILILQRLTTHGIFCRF